MNNTWRPDEYDHDFGFVTSLGAELIDELDPQPGELVVDIGCGTGHMAAEIAARGALVTGIDADGAMIAAAAAAHPEATWILADVQNGATVIGGHVFDAAISNAALHWMPRQADALATIAALLRPGARFVAEMGAAGNIATVDSALRAVLAESSLQIALPTNHFPTIAQQAALLEAAGFRVDRAHWFPRPTPLAAGQTPVDWIAHFRADAWQQVPAGLVPDVTQSILERTAAAGLHGPAGWHIDYCRLRFHATNAL